MPFTTTDELLDHHLLARSTAAEAEQSRKILAPTRRYKVRHFHARLVIAAGSRITSDFALLAQRTDFQYLFGNRYGEMAGSINL